MSYNEHDIRELWKRYLSKTATMAEVRLLFDLLGDPELADVHLDISLPLIAAEPSTLPADDAVRSAVWEQVLAAASGIREEVTPSVSPAGKSLVSGMQTLPGSSSPRRTIPSQWRWMAAASLLVLLTAGWWMLRQQQPGKEITTPAIIADIAPGGNKATLTLADGTIIQLDSARNGNIAQQGGSTITKLSNGELSYTTKGKSGGSLLWNKLSTPRGGQFGIRLPDGSRVWMNAASSVNFPATFAADKRVVKVTGEVFFEVEKDARRPFLVEIAGQSVVEVLGTSFNINAYGNESIIRTTLLEGSIKVNQVLLKPGFQAQVSASGDVTVAAVPKPAQVIAWKDGLFDFDGAGLPAVMRQLERWYDIDVKYEQTPANIIFKGKMYRNVALSDVLDMLREMGVKFKLEGRTLTVLK